MNYLPHIPRNAFLACILFLTYLVTGQDKNTDHFTGLQTTLSTSHQTKKEELFKELNAASKSIDSAIILNKISTIFLESSYYVNKPKFDSIIYYAEKSLRLIQNDKSTEGVQQYLISLERIGATYYNLGSYSKATEYFNKILSITENIPSASNYYTARESAITYMSLFYANQGKFTLAIKQYENLFAYISNKKIKDDRISSIVYLYLSRFHRKLGLIKTALAYALKAEKVALKNDIFNRVAWANFEIAQIKLTLNNTAESEFFLEKAFKLLKYKVESTGLLSEYYHIKAIIAQRNSNSVERIYNAEKAFELYNETIVSSKHVELGYSLYKAYKNNGNYKKANTILEKTHTIEKRLYNNDEFKKSALAEIQRKDKTVELAEAKSETKNKIIFWIIFVFVLGIFSVIHIYKDWKKKSKLAREISEKNKQLKQLDKVKSNFFSNITHELQTPLTLIEGPLELALEENSKTLDASTISKIQMAMNNTESLKTMINDMLDLSKLQAKKLILERESTDLDTFLNTTMRKFSAVMEQKKLHFQYCFKNLENHHAIVDTKKLKKILNNLLSNAIKYTPANGTISVCGQLHAKDTLVITVKDTGIGISTDDLPFVFDRYFQSKDASKPLEGGYGIGLSLVKELVEFMNGTIHVQSVVQKGSQFEVTLPLEKVDKKKYQNSQVVTSNPSADSFVSTIQDISKTIQQHTILIVEDHSEMQQFIASILQKDYQLVLAGNGKEAMEKLQNASIDLIVSDVMMPAMDGFTLLETLKESETYYDIPIIMLTALSDIKYKLNALTIGVDDYLTKPFIASELMARIQNLLQRYKRRKEFKEEIEATVSVENELLENTPKNNDIYVDSSVKTSKSDTELIAKVAEIIEENMDNPDFKLNDLTEKTYLSERQLRRKIKLITGLSPKKFQQEIQLLKARNLLEEDTYSNVKAVAISVGMQNTTRFSKLYVERFGKHPAMYFNT